MRRPCLLGGSQTRVCDTGPQFTPFSLFRGGSQRYGAIRTGWKESFARHLWLRPHQPPQSLRAVGQRPGNTTPAVAGCRRGAFSHLLGRRRLRKLRYQQPEGAGTLWTPGWARATPWLWCPSTASGGAGWTPWGTSTILQRRPVRIRSLAGNEQSWVQYLDADPESPESFLGLYPGRLRRLGVRPGTGVHPPPHQGGRQETGRSPSVVRRAGGRGHRHGSQWRQPAARCQVVRRIACDGQARRKA